MITVYKQFDKETLDSVQHRVVSSQDELTIKTTS